MADNYLEKQRADYEARKAAWEKAKRLGLAKPLGKKSIAKLKTDKK